MNIIVKPWNCTTCTFFNTKSYNICDICKTETKRYHFDCDIKDYTNQDKYKKTANIFHKKKVFFPVIHVTDIKQCMNNIKKIYKLKIDGVFLASNYCSSNILVECCKLIKSNYKDLWIGVNFVKENVFRVFEYIKQINIDGVWIDKSFISDDEHQDIPTLIIDQLKKINFTGLYFGSVFFKYNPMSGNKEKILTNASKYSDIITTSGEGTGIEIEKQKLELIYKSVKHRNYVCVSSGITFKNITNIKDICDIFIIGTSVNDVKHNIITENVIKFTNYIYAYNNL